MHGELAALDQAARAAWESATDSAAQDAWRQQYLNKKKGVLAPFFASMRDRAPEERKQFGQELNQLLQAWGTLAGGSRASEKIEATDWKTDPTLPIYPTPNGSLHPLTIVRRRIENIFLDLGFEIARGTHVENEFFNFEALNIPGHHPAREMQDTFYVDLPASDDGRWLLRTHTSPVQIHYMQSHEPPIRMIAPGRVFRSDHDATHSPMFQQVEGLWIEENVSFAHLKGVLRLFMSRLFKRSVQVRLRPSYFPFTEPSAEVDISCFVCDGAGCQTCSRSGWIEVLGCGMVHPEVIKAGGLDPDKHTGLAFGLGVERLAMLLFGIRDIRHFYRGSVEFLEQFRHEVER